MKNILISLMLLVSFRVFAVNGASTATLTFDCSQNDIEWKPVLAPTLKTQKGITIVNTSTTDLYIGVGLNGGASSGDVIQITVPAGTSPVSLNYFEFPIGQGYRISVKNAGTGAICSGKIQINQIFN